MKRVLFAIIILCNAPPVLAQDYTDTTGTLARARDFRSHPGFAPLAEVESRADKSRVADDAFLKRVLDAETRATKSVCDSCIAPAGFRSGRKRSLTVTADAESPYIFDPAEAPPRN